MSGGQQREVMANREEVRGLPCAPQQNRKKPDQTREAQDGQQSRPKFTLFFCHTTLIYLNLLPKDPMTENS